MLLRMKMISLDNKYFSSFEDSFNRQGLNWGWSDGGVVECVVMKKGKNILESYNCQSKGANDAGKNYGRNIYTVFSL